MKTLPAPANLTPDPSPLAAPRVPSGVSELPPALPNSLTVAQLRHRSSELCAQRGVDVMADYLPERGWFALSGGNMVVSGKPSQSDMLRALIAWLEGPFVTLDGFVAVVTESDGSVSRWEADDMHYEEPDEHTGWPGGHFVDSVKCVSGVATDAAEEAAKVALADIAAEIPDGAGPDEPDCDYDGRTYEDNCRERWEWNRDY